MKNYIGFVNDHSGSMTSIREAAMRDYNANITAIRDAANREMQDTVVSVVGIGYPGGTQVTRQVQISNPHVLKPLTAWPTNGMTPLYDGIASMIELLSSLPDANNPDVSFLVMITTDGEEYGSVVHNSFSVRNLINKVSATERWTFAFRMPAGGTRSAITALGIPEGNIQFWDTTSKGLAESTVKTQAAVSNYFAGRSAGTRSSSSFYADAAQVDTSALKDISKEISLYVVPNADNGIEIRDFILRHRMQYLKGAAFYQLTKTESRVSHTKQVAVRDRNTGKVYAGKDARSMIGLPNDRNARLHPGDHKDYDIFIQSESVNRKLVGGTGVVYWEKVGTAFTDADLAYLKPKVVVPAVVQLPVVPVSTRPTPSPIPVTKKVNTFKTRSEARDYCNKNGKSQTCIRDRGIGISFRWEVI